MIENIFFDTDCLSSFLAVNRETILTQLFKNKIMIPVQVQNELTRVYPFKLKLDAMLSREDATICRISNGTKESALYYQLTINPEPGYPIIGAGEASAISLALYNNGIVGSNNYKDIARYIKKFKIRNIACGDILVEALKNGIITEGQGNAIWSEMINMGRSLPPITFAEYRKLNK